MPLYWPSRLGSSFRQIPKALKWNCGIYKNFTLTNTNTIFLFGASSVSHLLLALNYKLYSLLTPPFYKIQSFIFSCLQVAAYSSLPLQLSMLSFSTLTLCRIDCVTSQRNVCVWGKKLGLMFYASPLSVSLNLPYQVHSPWSAVRSPILYWLVFILLIELKMCLLKWITIWEIIIADILLNC